MTDLPRVELLLYLVLDLLAGAHERDSVDTCHHRLLHNLPNRTHEKTK